MAAGTDPMILTALRERITALETRVAALGRHL